MLEAATNTWTAVEAAAAAALPKLAAFRSLVGAASEAAAVRHAFVEERGQPENGEFYTLEEQKDLKAYAVVASASESPYRLTRAGVATELLVASGSLRMWFELLVTDYDAHAEASADASRIAMERKFKNRIGDLMEQLVDYWDTSAGPYIRTVTVLDGPWHTHPEARATEGHWMGVEVGIEWGRRGS
jgi:hypothetical protein